MNKGEAKKWVARLTANSLRRMANRLKRDDLPTKSSEKDLEKCKAACLALAEKLLPAPEAVSPEQSAPDASSEPGHPDNPRSDHSTQPKTPG